MFSKLDDVMSSKCISTFKKPLYFSKMHDYSATQLPVRFTMFLVLSTPKNSLCFDLTMYSIGCAVMGRIYPGPIFR